MPSGKKKALAGGGISAKTVGGGKAGCRQMSSEKTSDNEGRSLKLVLASLGVAMLAAATFRAQSHAAVIGEAGQETEFGSLWQRPVPPQELETAATQVGCSLRSIDGLSRERLPQKIGTGLVIRGLTQDWPAARWTKDELLKRYGDQRANVRLAESVHHFNGVDAPSLPNMLSLREYLEINGSTGVIFENDYGDLDWALRDHGEYEIPKIFGYAVHEKPIFSLGGSGSGVGFHKHNQNWMAQVMGRKGWLLSQKPLPPRLSDDLHPCRLLAEGAPDLPSDVLTCIVQPGETIFVPTGTYHATCNVDEVTLGLGWEGDTSHWPAGLHFISDGSTEPPPNFQGYEPTAYIESQHEPQPPPMVHAALTGRVKVLKALADVDDPEGRWLDFSLDAANWRGEQAVHAAAKRGHMPVLEYLTMKGVDIAKAEDRQPKKRWTGMHYAAKAGHAEIVEHLLSMGGEANVADAAGERVLNSASFSGHFAVSRVLMAHGADVTAAATNGLTALHLAAMGGHAGVVRLLVEKGAALEAVCKEGKDAGGRPAGGTPLHFAVTRGYAVVLEELLAARADATGGGAGPLEVPTPLHSAAREGHLSTAQLLLRARAEPGKHLGAAGQSRTPLSVAESFGSTAVAKLLAEWRR